MLRSLPLGCLVLLVAVSAWAAQPLPGGSLYYQQNSRLGAIPRNQAQEIITPAQDCITAINATLKSGRCRTTA